MRFLRLREEQEMERYENRRREEEQFRRELEAKEWKKVEEDHMKKLEGIRRTNEDDARKQAEECNDFRHRYANDASAAIVAYEKEMKAMKEKQRQRDACMIRQLKRNKV